MVRQNPRPLLGLGQSFGIPCAQRRIVVLGQTHWRILADDIANRTRFVPHADLKFFRLFLLCFDLRVNLLLGRHQIICGFFRLHE